MVSHIPVTHFGIFTNRGRVSSYAILRSRGVSLIELLVVVTILGIVAAVVIPNLSSQDSRKLDLAAAEVAEAIRFARAEAMRSGVDYGIETSNASDRVRVYSLPFILPVFKVHHPVDKNLYTIQLNKEPHFSGVDLVSALFSFDGIFSSSTHLGFNADGNPKHTAGFPRRDYMLVSGSITLSYNGASRVISIAPMTGRVSIQ